MNEGNVPHGTSVGGATALSMFRVEYQLRLEGYSMFRVELLANLIKLLARSLWNISNGFGGFDNVPRGTFFLGKPCHDWRGTLASFAKTNMKLWQVLPVSDNVPHGISVDA